MDNITQSHFRDFLQDIQADFEAELGLRFQLGAELEFYIYPKGRALSTNRLIRCRQTLLEAGILVDAVTAETHPSQYEICFTPRYEASDLADCIWEAQNVVCRHFQKDGLFPTFSAKPYRDSPGSGLHIHISIHDNEYNNMFEIPVYENTEPFILQNSIEGLCLLMNESMIFFACNHQSYDRYNFQDFDEEYRYSAAPTTISWGGNNRTVALRIPDYSRSRGSRRVEHRVPGADANPYLVIASIIASISYGIRSQLSLSHPKVWVDAIRYPDDLPRLVSDLSSARRAFAASGKLRDLILSVRHQKCDKISKILFENC